MDGQLRFSASCGADGKVVGIITDRDICVALGTRGRPSGDATVADAIEEIHAP